MSTLRILVFGTLAVGSSILWCSPAGALVVGNVPGVVPDTTVNPAAYVGWTEGDPGWATVTQSGTNYTYLSDGWVLSARHVGVNSVNFSTGTFQPIPGQDFIVDNPPGFDLNGQFQTDLRLIRIDGDPGLPSLTIASQSPPSPSSQVVFVGQGNSRQATETHWNVTENSSDDWNWTETGGAGDYQGYETVGPRVKRWGTNQLADTNDYTETFDQVLSDTTGVLQLKTADGITRNIISMISTFDEQGQPGATSFETQAIAGNSGSAVFYNRLGQWELAGVVHAILTYTDQPGGTGVYGNGTIYSDLSYYNQSYSMSITDIMDSHPNYSILGDVNLNGVVSGDGTGPATTDDVTAFIAGWGYSTGVADITSWKNGDLSGPTGLRDGYTDLFDFLALRDAINGPISSAALAAIGLGHLAVPEPSAALLALVAGSFLFSGMRRRRIRPVG